MLYLGQNVKEAVDARRLHHQLFPMNLNYEDGITTVGDCRLGCDFVTNPAHCSKIL